MSFFKEPAYYYFLLQLLFSFGWGGFTLAACLKKILANEAQINKQSGMLFLIGLGLSPYFIALLLYYLLFLLPHFSDLFYVFTVVLSYVLLAWVARKEMRLLLSDLLAKVRKLRPSIRLLLFIGACAFLFGWSAYLNIKSISEHDTLEYAVQGKVFYETKEINYEAHNYDEESGFYYVGLHGYSFPLLATWERMVNALFNVRSDLFFRSLNSLYGILILLTTSLIAFRKEGRILAGIVFIALLCTYGFYETVFKYHIDFYRIFFLNMSLLGMVLLIKKPSMALAITLGMLLGAQANAHSLGALLYALQIGVIFFALPISGKNRWSLTVGLLAVSLLFGSLHYLLDVIWGTGWIFQEIKFY